MREEELIRLSQLGDWNAFEVLLERYRTPLSRTAFLRRPRRVACVRERFVGLKRTIRYGL